MTPLDGPVETVNLATVFLDAGVTRTVLTKAEPSYEQVREERENINRAMRPLMLGFRPGLALRFDLTSPDSHHPTIAQLITRAMDPYWRVELSLDNGTTYREMTLRRAGSPRPFGGKTVAGFSVEHVFQAKDLISTYPDIKSGSSW